MFNKDIHDSVLKKRGISNRKELKGGITIAKILS